MHEHAAANVSTAHRAGGHLRSCRIRCRRCHGAGMTDLAFMTMAEASRLIRARKLSPVELTAALLARIAALDGVYHAYIAVTAESALAQAKAAEAEIAAGRLARAAARDALCAEGHLRCRGAGDDLPFQAAHES